MRLRIGRIDEEMKELLMLSRDDDIVMNKSKM